MADAQATHLYRAIHAQPEAVRTLLADQGDPARAAEKLARAGRILIAGIGTSFHATQVGEYLLRMAGADAWAVRSFEFVNYPRPLRSDDAVIVISHRGSKMFSAMAVERAKDAGVHTIAITGKNTKLPRADIMLETVEQDPSPTNSISYVGALTRLAQIAARLASLTGYAEQAQALERGLSQTPALMENILAREDEVRQVAQEAVQRRIYFVGGGPNAATATEGALKAKEASYVTTEGFELEQFLHGPEMALEAEDLLIPINVAGAAQQRMADLLLAMSEVSERVWLIGAIPNAETEALFQRPGWSRFALADSTTLSAFPEALTPLLAALPVQLLSNFLAAARGTNADSFRQDHEPYKRARTRLQL
ncbi:MAG TPA: SIS domain-containing protein [Ktedonobacteraceae bacterium]|nr:SIS domain-containing protein [Ktedonobacteraceae bacterium]